MAHDIEGGYFNSIIIIILLFTREKREKKKFFLMDCLCENRKIMNEAGHSSFNLAKTMPKRKIIA